MSSPASIPDLRWKITLRVQRFLQGGSQVWLIAGPKMGKTFLCERLLTQIPNLEIIDLRRQPEPFFTGTELNIDSLARYLAAGKTIGTLWVIPTAMYFRSGCPSFPHARRVPLICCMPRDLKANYPDLTDLFDRTLGHPYLVQGILSGHFEKNLLELQTLWSNLLSNFPEASAIFNDLAKYRTLDPTALYQKAVRQFQNHRFNLDLLCNAGMITRMIYHEDAGIRIHPPRPLLK